MMKTETYHIHISGQVQGVGFRPFVARLALKYNLCGQVSNTTDGVHIDIVCDKFTLRRFINEIISNHPKASRITTVNYEIINAKVFPDFRILNSSESPVKSTYISPDLGICLKCAEELFDPQNRRYLYPFITCTDCGPRLSITNDIPYDRSNTTMSSFEMCDQCKKEYKDPEDRRYHSQTNSCTDCAIKLDLTHLSDDGSVISLRYTDPLEIIKKTVEKLQHGSIIAVKSNGGFLLMCDASNTVSIRLLRLKKRRPTKPFALLYPSIAEVLKDAILSEPEKENLTAPSFPIVICRKKYITSTGAKNDEISPNSSLTGIMLPYNPILSLITYIFGGPLIATSANMSGSPILFKKQQIIENLGHVADYILDHNRDIVQPQDDSVIRFSPFYNQKIILRRSRGLAPAFWQKSDAVFPNILAAGADMKSCIGIAKNTQIYLSQFLGNLTGYDNQLIYKYIIREYIKFTGLRPEVIVKDKHPDYHSSHLVYEGHQVPTFMVQHHKAHFASILFEHNYWDSHKKCLGIIWDGVGYGDDGHVWGGEFFTYSQNMIERKAHFNYFPYLIGDKMSLQPRLSALCLLKSINNHAVKEKFSDKEWSLYTKMLDRYSGKYSSSAGRIFDAVASLLGCGDYNTYEGESALMLEQLAMQHISSSDIFSTLSTYEIPFQNNIFLLDFLFENILKDLRNGVNKSFIAASFHKSMVYTIKKIAEHENCKNLFFSGGVFQNALLADMIIYFLNEEFNLHFHEQISPNDENIALGQIILTTKFSNKNFHPKL